MNKPAPTDSLQDVKTYLRSSYSAGCQCPACGQTVKLYKRKLNSIMARLLIKLMHMPAGYHHVTEISTANTGSQDFSKLRYWGLISEKPNDKTDKRTSGLWMITDKGRSFARNEIKVQKRVLIYNGKMQGFSEDHTDIIEALGDKFDYQELMRE